MRKLLLALLLASLPACHDRIIAVTAAPAEVDRPGQMTVTGTATLDVSPDCADLTMTLAVDNVRPAAATAGVTQKEDAVVAALERAGVAKTDLKLSLVSLEPIYEPLITGGWRTTPSTYRASITVTATTRDFAKISALMEAGANAGATQLSSQFRRSDMPELKKKVRDMALAAAKDKAQQTAKALGIELGRVVSVAENPGGMMWSQTYFPQVANVESSANAHVALGGTLQPLTLEVTIGYELSRKV